MKRRMNWVKRVLATGLCLSMLSALPNMGYIGSENAGLSKVYATQSEETTKKETVQNGAILQAFCWSFDTITENMADIAAAGYTAIQTSPINECEDSYPALTWMGNNGKWYYHYQPTDWKIGNYQMGTRDEFITMCEAADEYGIQVIVDILPNHTAVILENVSQDLLDAVGGQENLYHDTGFDDMTSYSDRLQCTYYASGGLPDVDTENADFQEYFFAYLEDCIACGADGFRIDTAKHIALPDDPVPEGSEVENNFYPNMNEQVMDGKDVFVYGEVLQGGNERLGAYQEAIGGTTASSYGASIRTALDSNDYSVSRIQDYQIEDDADPSKLVTWVESHDNYLNDGTWSMLDETQIKLGWAIIGARADGTPLFFSRPSGSSTTNQYGDNTIGIAGSDIYKNDEVAAVNKFRVAMAGEEENLRNPNNNSQILMVERGDKGVVIVNGSHTAVTLDSETNLADGTYVNKTEDNSVFTVSDGVINGTLPARSSVVLYEEEAEEQTTVLFYNSEAWTSVSAKINDSEETIAATNNGDGWWSVTVSESLTEGFTVTFTDGESVSETFALNETSGRYVTGAGATVYASKAEAEEALGIVKTSVYFFNNNCWDSVSAYAWGTAEVLGGWPGTAAVYEGNYWWRVDVPAAPSDGLNIIFNDNNNGNQTGDFLINDSTNVYTTGASADKFASKEAAEEAIGISSTSTVVYFYNYSAWEEVYAYTYGAASLGEWPGSAAENVGDGWWKVQIPAGASADLHVIFNDNNNGQQSADFVISNIRDIYTTGKNNTKYASLTEAEEALGLSNTEVTVYYYDTDEWDNVYAYAKDASTNEEYLGEYPGTAMTADYNGWHYITVPAGASENLQVTFNNGAEETSETFSVSDRTKVYLTGADNTAYGSKIEAETALGVELSVTKVHFYNSDNWANVSAYVYGDLGEAFGGWPGTAATDEGDGWWSATIPGLASSGLYIIFNDNNNGHQSADYNISDQNSTYTINLDENVYASKEEAEAAIEAYNSEVTVYYYDTDEWATTYAYAKDVTTNEEYLGAWPGTAMTEDYNGWQRIAIRAVASENLQISFNDGEESNANVFTVADKTNVYFTGASDTVYSGKLAAEEALGVELSTTKVYFYDSQNQGDLYGYAYGDLEEALGVWPGTAMTDEGDGWWSIVLPGPASSNLHLIVTNNNGWQSADYKITDQAKTYASNVDGNLYTKEEAEEVFDVMPGLEPAPVENPFGDVKDSDWFYPYVMFAYKYNLMGGKGSMPDGSLKFDPAKTITRAEFVQMLYSKEGKPAVEYVDTFTDVADDKWYTDAILWAAAEEIVGGKKADFFDVNGMITRQEIALILYKYALYNEYNTEELANADFSGFSDASKISTWAENGMKWAVSYDVIGGKTVNGETLLSPGGNAIRAEAATMMRAFMTAYEGITE